MALEDLPEVLTVAEAAQAARVSTSSIYRAVASGDLRGCRTSSGGGRAGVRIMRTRLIEWLNGDTASNDKAVA
jgi:excisionase family DNA binding protein